MLELTINYDWKEWMNKETGEVKKYRSFYVMYNNIKIPVKPIDNTALQILNQAFDTLENINKK